MKEEDLVLVFFPLILVIHNLDSSPNFGANLALNLNCCFDCIICKA